jgi:hypothetical protein
MMMELVEPLIVSPLAGVIVMVLVEVIEPWLSMTSKAAEAAGPPGRLGDWPTLVAPAEISVIVRGADNVGGVQMRTSLANTV